MFFLLLHNKTCFLRLAGRCTLLISSIYHVYCEGYPMISAACLVYQRKNGLYTESTTSILSINLNLLNKNFFPIYRKRK